MNMPLREVLCTLLIHMKGTIVRHWSELQRFCFVRYYRTLPNPHSQHSRFTCRTVLYQPTFQCFRSAKRGQNMAPCALDLSSRWPRHGIRQYFPSPSALPLPCAS